MPESLESAAPTRIQQYVVQHRLGAGGMGEVFVAEDTTLERRVALKRIRSDQRLDPERRARFLREARVLSQLDHPSICTIYDYLQAEEEDYLVLEFVPGETLAAAIARGLPRRSALQLASEIADVLVAAHAAGIVHRDLKPTNVMVTDAGAAKVLDFGLAHQSASDQSEPRPDDGESEEAGATLCGSVLGTLAYMSPEQARGEPATPASDVFSLGLVMRELFGLEPSRPDGLSQMELFERAHSGYVEPVPLRGALGVLLNQMADVAPSRRPTALDCVSRLERIIARPQRLRRYGAAALGVTAALTGAVKYTLDLGAANAAAREGWGNADELIRFQLSDLYERLEPIGRTGVLLEAGQRAVDYFDARGALSPRQRLDAARARYYFGRVQRDLGDLTAAEESLRASLSLAVVPSSATPEIAADAWERALEAHLGLGLVARDRGDLPQAELDVAAALAACDALERVRPGSTVARAGRALALSRRAELAAYDGDLARSGAVAREALAAAATLEGPEIDPDWWLEGIGWAHFYAGYAALDAGELDEAEAEFRAYQDVALELHDAAPNDQRYLLEVASSHTNLGGVFEARGDMRAAYDEFARGVDASRALAQQDPANASLQMELCVAISWLAESARNRGELTRAAELFDEEREIRAGLARRDPGNLEWAYGLSLCHDHLASVHEWRGELELADESLRRAIAIGERLVREAPDQGLWPLHLSRLEVKRSALEHRTSPTDSAHERLEASVLELAELVAGNPDDEAWNRSLAGGYLELAGIALDVRDGDAAASWHRLAETHVAEAGQADSQLARVDWLRTAARLSALRGDEEGAETARTNALQLLDELETDVPHLPALARRAQVLADAERWEEESLVRDALEGFGYRMLPPRDAANR